MKRTDIVSQISGFLHRIEPTADVVLYGSEARGDARADSDIDLLIMLDNPDMEKQWAITDGLLDIEGSTGVSVSSYIVPKSWWNQKPATPFSINVHNEGILI